MPPTDTTLTLDQAGTYVLEDNGVVGDNFSRLRAPDGTVTIFEHPTSALNVFASLSGATLVINLTDSLGAASINVGSLADAAQTPDQVFVRSVATTGAATLVSNGSIRELGSDAAADIVAGTLVLSAAAGIGTSGALETQVGILEAETDTGGINLSNFGTLTVGGLTDLVDGLDVFTSGNLSLTNSGTISLSDVSAGTGSGESVHGGTTSGNVTLIANGFDADILSNVDIVSIEAPSGSIVLQAGRDILFGTIGTNFNNDVLANGSITITAVRDFVVDGFADISSDAFFQPGTGNLSITAGRDINITKSTGTSASVGASGSEGSDVTLTTGPGGFLRLTAPSTGALFSSSGDIRVNADRMIVDPGSGISTFSGSIEIAPSTAGWAIDLGSNSDSAFALELSNSELDRISTATLVIGSLTSGPLEVTSAVSPDLAINLQLLSATDIRIRADTSVTDTLSLFAGDDVFVTAALNVATFKAFVDQAGDDGGTGGIANLTGLVTASSSSTLTGNTEVDTLIGTNASETLNGLAGNDSLRGGEGNDTLDGGVGTDLTNGGPGDDLHIIDGASDVAIEAAGQGTDTVRSTVSYTIGANIENLQLTGAANINGTGNAENNTLTGNGGANILNGLTGADNMIGGLGDDSYIADESGDRAIETSPAGGFDQVSSSASFTLEANVENLTLTGGAAIDGTGNAGVNTLIGNGADNVLDGKAGADTMNGGAGNDTYGVDVAGDVIVDSGGIDTVRSSISFTLAVNLENLTLTGGSAINGTGNSGANVITGNNAINTLNGGDGNDTLNGGGAADTMNGGIGNDTFVVDNFGDIVTEAAAAGTDTVQSSISFTLGSNLENLALTGAANVNGTGNAVNNALTGNSGNNLLNGLAGADTMTGGGGNDTYVVDNVSDKAIETAAGGTDTVQSSVSITILDEVENLTLTGAGAINGAGNALDNTIVGNGAANILNGRDGNDTLNGGAGADIFRFDSALNAGTNVDDIIGYSVADDTIFLNRAIFTGIAANGTLAAGAFRASTAAVDADDRILYDSATGQIFYDSDGVGGVAAILFATVTPATVLSNADFVGYT